MAEKNIFELADKFGYKSPFGDWIAERQTRENEEIQKKENSQNTVAAYLKQDFFIYEMADWREMHRNLPIIRTIFFRALNYFGSYSNLTITPNSGWINFKNKELFSSRKIKFDSVPFTNNELNL